MTLQSGRQFIAILLCCIVLQAKSQTIYFPQHSSDLLKSTAVDLADLLTRAGNGINYNALEYGPAIPQSGIVLNYDSTMSPGQNCKIVGNSTWLKFSAAEDNGLCFGVYKYLNMLGFRFYLPGSIWEKIPSLNSPFQNINTTVSGSLKYNNWNISGGHNRWAMDNDNTYSWDIYFGNNGHEWAKYQRRNTMTGSNRFNGHRGDILTSAYLTTLQQNPCYVACFDHSRVAGAQAVPDINSIAAKSLWASALTSQYSNYRTAINSNVLLYANQYHNFDYTNNFIGIEVPDGAHWGNSSDNGICSSGNFNGNPYPKQSDQQFLLANHSAEVFLAGFPGKRLQCYAYSDHANIPSIGININPQLDVQVIPAAFQFETSARGLLNRWYNRHSHISEYHYLNIPQWTGEAPIFSLDELKTTWQRIKAKNADGIVVEASPAKFASLPFLFAGNRFLQDNKNVDSSLDEFVNDLFPVETAIHIRQLLNYFGDQNINANGSFIKDNKYKIPLFLDELNKAVIASGQSAQSYLVLARLKEFKAYLHYLVLYYDFIKAPGTYASKADRVSVLCKYLARINKLQVVNSYFLISNLISNYHVSDSMFLRYNVNTGTAYQNGALPLITGAEIDAAFSSDLVQYLNTVTDYKIETRASIISKINEANLKAVDTIKVKIGYTNGYEYSNRSEFYFYAATKGKINFQCVPHFGMETGLINITLESDDQGLNILRDFTISPENIPGAELIDIPSQGIYKLSIVSKFKASADLTIATYGNMFFKQGPFYGDKVENYREDTNSLPKYFYVPAGIQKLYFSVNNACNITSGCVSTSEIQNAFGITNSKCELVTLNKSASDSSLYMIDIPIGTDHHFWKVSKMREYNLCFSNISNIELYAEPRECKNLDFSASVIHSNGECHTRLIAGRISDQVTWQIKDGAQSYSFGSSGVLDLPVVLSPSAIITMKTNDCYCIKKTGDIPGYIKDISTCASSTAPISSEQISGFPNPTQGPINFVKGGAPVELTSIRIFDSKGIPVAHFENKSKADISQLPGGVYIISASAGKGMTRFKVVKM